MRSFHFFVNFTHVVDWITCQFRLQNSTELVAKIECFRRVLDLYYFLFSVQCARAKRSHMWITLEFYRVIMKMIVGICELYCYESKEKKVRMFMWKVFADNAKKQNHNLYTESSYVFVCLWLVVFCVLWMELLRFI